VKDAIGVVTPTHPSRMRNGMTQRAVSSAMTQLLQPEQICVYNDVNRRGAPFARQRALEMNDCEWTAFLDSDDYLKPEHLEVLMAAQRETGADYVYSWYDLVHLGTVLQHDPVFPTTHYTEPWNDDEPRQTTITVLVRTGLAKEVGFWDVSDEQTFPDGHRVGEDYNFTLGCLKLGAQFHHVVQKTWFWEHHGGNTSGRPTGGDAR
jgi:glycosyltransferase involved in cell wall biosynthesis